MTTTHLSTHQRYALLARFAPCDIIESITRDTRHGVEGHMHFWGQMDGEGVDILLGWGGVYKDIAVRCASLAPPEEERLSSEQIAQAVREVLSVDG